MNRTRMLHLPTLAAALTLTALCRDAAAVDIVPDFLFQTPSCVGACGTVTTPVNDIIGTSSPTGPLPGGPLYGYISTSGGVLGAASLGAELKDSKTLSTTGSTIQSSTFTAQDGDSVKINFNFITSDGSGFGDYAWARLLQVSGTQTSTVAWLFTAQSTNNGTSLISGNILDNSADLPTPGDRVTQNVLTNPITTSPVWAPLGLSSGDCFVTGGGNGCGSTGWLQSQYEIDIQPGTTRTYALQFGVSNAEDERFQSGLAFNFAGMTSPTPEPSTFALMGTALALFGFQANRRRRQRSA